MVRLHTLLYNTILNQIEDKLRVFDVLYCIVCTVLYYMVRWAGGDSELIILNNRKQNGSGRSSSIHSLLSNLKFSWHDKSVQV